MLLPEAEPNLRERADGLLQDDTVTISEAAVVMLPLLETCMIGGPIDWKYQPLLRRLATQGKSLHDEVARLVPKHERARLKS